jgi:hypothetical protein
MANALMSSGAKPKGFVPSPNIVKYAFTNPQSNAALRPTNVGDESGVSHDRKRSSAAPRTARLLATHYLNTLQPRLPVLDRHAAAVRKTGRFIISGRPATTKGRIHRRRRTDLTRPKESAPFDVPAPRLRKLKTILGTRESTMCYTDGSPGHRGTAPRSSNRVDTCSSNRVDT